ncbi:MAG: MFS transporter [Geminicoccaceae bacterium]|nr:MAG: MFS transporter [Geminicoccaceae bacterium]
MYARGIANLTQAFQNRDFARFTAGNAVSLVGMWGLRIAVGWLAWELTEQAFWVGLVAFADLFPTIVITPLAGAIADRRSRLAIVRVCQLISMAIVVALTVLIWTERLTVELLALLVLANGLVMGFKQPSRMALTRILVRPKDLPTAIAVNAIVFNLARFVGPSLAGLLIVTVGVEAVLVFDVLSSAFFLAVIRAIHLDAPPARAGQRTLGGDIVDGIRYAASHPGIGPIMLLMLVLGICMRAYIELLPAYSALILARGADGLAIMSAGIGAGAILAGLWLTQRDGLSGLTRLVVINHTLSALSLLALAFAPSLWLATFAVVVNGFSLAMAGIASQTLTQRVVDEAMLGRIMSLYGVIFRAGPAAGALAMGALADLFGLRTPFLAGAALSLLACLVVGQRLLRARTALEATTP